MAGGLHDLEIAMRKEIMKMKAAGGDPDDEGHDLEIAMRKEIMKMKAAGGDHDDEGEDLSFLIIGGSALPGIYTSLSPAKATATIATALQLGCRNFDTAPHYGLGLGEERLGEALTASIDDGDGETAPRLKVWSKVGRVIASRAAVPPGREGAIEAENCAGAATCIFPDTPADRVPLLDYSFDGVRESLAGSRARLNPGDGTKNSEAVPIHGLRLHDPEDEDRLSATVAPGGGLDGLLALRSEGAVAEVGLGMNYPAWIMRVLEEYPRSGELDSVMMAGRWNLLDQSGLPVLGACSRHGLEVHNAGIFASGLLAGGTTLNYAAAPPEAVEKAGRWGALAAKHGFSLAEAAVAFALLPAAVTRVAIGVKSPREAREAVAMLRKVLAAGGRGLQGGGAAGKKDGLAALALWRDAEALGLLPKGIVAEVSSSGAAAVAAKAAAAAAGAAAAAAGAGPFLIESFADERWRWRGEPGAGGNGGTWSLRKGGASAGRGGAGQALVVAPEPQRDYWSRTFYDPPLVKHDGQALLAAVPGGREAEATLELAFTLTPVAQFDQAGCLVRVDDGTWVKAGIEFADGAPRLSCVVTNDRYADWSTAKWADWRVGGDGGGGGGGGGGDGEGSAGGGTTSVRLRVHKLWPGTTQGQTLLVEAAPYRPGDGPDSDPSAFDFVRIASIRPPPGSDGGWEMGPFCFAPLEQKGCSAQFHYVRIGPALKPGHDASVSAEMTSNE